MSEESVIGNLFDRWERVWHEGQYELAAKCVVQVYTRNNEAGARRAAPEESAVEFSMLIPQRGCSHSSSVRFVESGALSARGG